MSNVRREFEQISAREVPGFHARTVIDDTIGKLYALRSRLTTDIPAEVPGLLDDVEARVEMLIDIAYDSAAEPIEDGRYMPNVEMSDQVRRYCAGRLSPSGSGAVSHCSCGGLFLDDTIPESAVDDSAA